MKELNNHQYNYCFTLRFSVQIQCHLQQNFSYIVLVSFIGWENQSTLWENHWPVVCYWQAFSHNVVSSIPRHERNSNLQHLWSCALIAQVVENPTTIWSQQQPPIFVNLHIMLLTSILPTMLMVFMKKTFYLNDNFFFIFLFVTMFYDIYLLCIFVCFVTYPCVTKCNLHVDITCTTWQHL